MKIKKKDYEKQLADNYWNGVKAGINYALDHPEEAEKYRNRTEMLRKFTEQSAAAMRKLSETLSTLFK